MIGKPNKRNINKGQRGSMTVEAVIVLPAFLLLFMFMMYMVNICHIYLTLNHAVDQTTKFNANNAYLYAKIVSFRESEETPQNISVVKNMILASAKTYIGGAYEESVTGVFEGASEKMLRQYVENTQIDKDEVNLTLYKMPKGEIRGRDADQYENQFQREDIVIRAEYLYTLSLPLVGDQRFPIVSTCVERAWINGGSSEYLNTDDGNFFEFLTVGR